MASLGRWITRAPKIGNGLVGPAFGFRNFRTCSAGDMAQSVEQHQRRDG